MAERGHQVKRLVGLALLQELDVAGELFEEVGQGPFVISGVIELLLAHPGAQLTVSGVIRDSGVRVRTDLRFGPANCFILCGTLLAPSAKLFGDAITDNASRSTVRPRTIGASTSSDRRKRRLEPLSAQS